MKGRVLIIAGSDSGGGGGIQADIKTVTALGGYAMTAVTAITVQNTLGVQAVHPIPTDIITGQVRAVMEDIGADVIKIGMLGTAEIAKAVAAALDSFAADVPVVLDPVMVAKGGHPLLAPDAVAAVRERLLPRAAIVTPNAPEAGALTGVDVVDAGSQFKAGSLLLEMGARAALVKGGHIEGPVLRDLLVTADAIAAFEGPRIETAATHGTGCTLASAIAAHLAQGASLEDAVRLGREYLVEAIRRAPGFGGGHGPVDHAWTVRDAASRNGR